MNGSGKERFILTKSYEIAYALFRLAATIKEADFAEKLRTAAGDLLQAVAAEDYGVAGKAAQVVECLVKFGGDVNVIGTANADITLREIYALDAAIAERKNAAKTEEVNVAEIFSKPQSGKNNNSGNEHSGNNPAMDSPATIHSNEPAIEPTIRQSAILEHIRQSGNCRIKEIQEFLPDTSERTIRYDLQALVERNLVERVGSGGPAVFYRAVPVGAGVPEGGEGGM